MRRLKLRRCGILGDGDTRRWGVDGVIQFSYSNTVPTSLCTYLNDFWNDRSESSIQFVSN
jgi:hypothetical protein